MRVIAGEAKGRRLKQAKGEEVRPMTDRVRSAVFSSLSAHRRLSGSSVLDLYSGSGAIGIEALSRGAGRATFVEQDPAAVSTIHENLAVTRLADRAKVERSSVESFLAYGASTPSELVFVDPPFRLGLPSAVLTGLVEGGFLSKESLVVLQISSRTTADDLPVNFEVVSQKRYGDSKVLYLQVKGS